MKFRKLFSKCARKMLTISNLPISIIFPLFDSWQFIGFAPTMITLTESAATEIKKLQAEKASPGQLLRIFVEAGGCSGFEYGMSFDDKKAGDLLQESQGIEFLIDPTSHEYLEGSEVHFDDGLAGKGFDVRNPNASSTCGCGRSFN